MTASYPDVRSRLIVALDVSSRDDALRLIEKLRGTVGMVKVGLQLFSAEGPTLVREIVALGEKVFLDLKFHDIPNTVAGAVRSAANLGVSILNVHAQGGTEMMEAAALAISTPVDATDGGLPTIEGPAVLGVTLLTSLGESDLAEIGLSSGPEQNVVRLARLARNAGLDGVVASPREIRIIREQVASEGFIVLVPGIRPSWSAAVGDQKRVATPAQAIRDGADYIVIGRPITNDPDPRSAALRILEEIS
jgi:orotidine-5'-phosphate decarboxylase